MRQADLLAWRCSTKRGDPLRRLVLPGVLIASAISIVCAAGACGSSDGGGGTGCQASTSTVDGGAGTGGSCVVTTQVAAGGW